ncbi:MAG: hypothetical protein ACOYKN_21930 [Pirellula sp.]
MSRRKKSAYLLVSCVSIGMAAYYGMATEVAHAMASIGLGSLMHALFGHRISQFLDERAPS